MLSRATSCRAIGDIDWSNRIIRPLPPPSSRSITMESPQTLKPAELMEPALAALPACSHSSKNAVWIWIIECEERGRLCRVMTLQRAMVTVGRRPTCRAERSGPARVAAVVTHVISVSQRKRHERCMTPTQHSRPGRNTDTQGHRYMCRDTATGMQYVPRHHKVYGATSWLSNPPTAAAGTVFYCDRL